MATSNDWDDVNSWNDSDEWNDFMTTFIGLTDTPNQYGANQRRFLQVSGESDVIIFNDIELNTLIDVQSTGPDAPTVGDVLTWTADNHWRPVSNDPYSAGNGLSKTGGTLNVVAGIDGGLTANASGIFLTTIANVSGTYGNATYVPQFTVNDKGQITAIDVVEGSFAVAESLNASYVGNISGTAGAINVTGGTGINSNATVSLVATGVTAGTYGNATYSPVITVDTYGRIQNVDLVENIGGGGGNGNVDLSTVTTEAFKSIAVAGQTTVSADTKDDTLTFVAGTGMQITTTAGTDTITFSTNISTNQITDIDATGATEGQALVYDAGNAIFKPGTVAGSGGGASVTVSDTAPVGASNGDLWWRSDTGKLKIYYDDGTSQQWVDASPASSNSANYSDGTIILPTNQTPDTSEGSITWDPVADTLYVGDGSSAVAITGSSYGDVQVQAYLDAQGYSNVDSDSQTLTWDAANVNLAISGGNDVTLFDQSLDTTDDVTFNHVNTEQVTGASQLLLNAGASGITASTNGNMQFNATSGAIYVVTPTLDAQVSAFLANTITANALTVNGQTITAYGNTEVQTYLDAQGYSNVDSDGQTLTWDEANSNISISGGNTVTLTGIGGGSTGIYTIDSSSAGGTGTGDASVQAWIGCPAASTAVDKVWTVKHNTDDGYVYALVSYTYATAGYSPALRRSGFGDTSGQTYSFFDSGATNLTGCAAHGGAYFPVLLQSKETYASVDDVPTMGLDSEGYIQYLGPEYTFRGIDIGSNLATLPIAIQDGVAIGDGADADTSGVSIGPGSHAGQQSVAIGLNADASTNFTTALGFNALATGPAGSAIGHECEATGSATVAMGSDCTATNSQAIAIGYKSDVSGVNSIGIGHEMDVSGSQTVAIAHNPGAYSVSDAVLIQAGGTTKIEVYPDVVNLTSTNVSLTYDSTNSWVFGAAVSVGSENVLQSLTWDSGNSNLSISGGNTVTLTGVGGGLNNVVEDTTPQLGGNLDINSQFIAGALIPDTNNTYDLGTAELKWRDLYLNSGSIYLGDVVLSTVANVLQANVEGTLKNVSFGGDPVVTSSVKPENTNAEAVDGTVTNVTGGDADGINSTGGDLIIDGGVGAIGNGSIKIGTVSTAAVDIGGASTTTTINGQTTFTNDARFDTGVEERFSTINAATGTVVHDCDNGHVFRHTSPSADWTANFTNLGLTTSYATTVTLVIDQGVTARIPTAVQIGGVAQTLLWQGGSPPTGTANGEDVVSFSILNSGGTYTVLGQLVGFS